MHRKDIVFIILGGFFLTNALLAEMIGGKIICLGDPEWRVYLGPREWGLGPLGPFAMSVGIIPWPVVFVTTDLTNEYFGKRGVRRLTFLTVGMIAYAFIVLTLTMQVPAMDSMGVDTDSYNSVFGQSRWIIVGSLTAFLVAQLIDVFIFHVVRRFTGKSLIWLRATGSTVVSQLIDSVIVLYIGLALPRGWSFGQFASVAATNYTVKLVVAIGATPLIYLGHWVVERYLGKTLAASIAEEAARDSR